MIKRPVGGQAEADILRPVRPTQNGIRLPELVEADHAVTDTSGAVVASAKVTVMNVDTGPTSVTTTDGAGLYRSALLPAGSYSVTVEHEGFQAQVRDGRLHVGAVITIDFGLAPAAQTATVDVVGDALVLETSKNTLSRLVTKEEIDALPVVSRNFNALASLAPGVTSRSMTKASASASPARPQ